MTHMTEDEFRALNARLGYLPEDAERRLHDRRADERRERAAMAAERADVIDALHARIIEPTMSSWIVD